mmetsp:Transcript_1770/g.3817  ORF Transcript_1770/g.3817 Transcript_1770/m.3817 type:complete len:370 (+) Transcript_1770:1062-2171(+)
MGNICVKTSFPTKKNIKECLVKSIENDELACLTELIQRCVLTGPRDSERLKLDEPIMFKHTIPMSALTYSLVLGKCLCFRYLYEEAGASLSVMHDQISYLRKKPIDILIDDCNLHFLDYYLPIHLLYHNESLSTLSNGEVDDLSLISTNKGKPKGKYLMTLQPSIHRVVEKGNLRALKYLLSYFSGKDKPSDFNVHHIDEVSGENCALVGVRSGDLEMLRFLHEHCKADFNVLNKRRESALQVAAAASKKKPKVGFLLIMRFLIEEVKVDLAYNCEETLMLCEDANIIAYLEDKFEAIGISVKKCDLEEAMPQNCILIHRIDADQVAKMRYYEQATVSELIREEQKKRNSLSTIRRLSQESTFTQDLPF